MEEQLIQIGIVVIAILSITCIIYIIKIYKRTKRNKKPIPTKQEVAEPDTIEVEKQSIFTKLKANRTRKREIGKYDTWK